MTPTERFEMRLEQRILERLDEWRARQSDLPSRSEAVRQLLDKGLSGEGEGWDIQLSDGDKLILMMLSDLFKSLKIKSETDPDFVSNAILRGQFWGLQWRYPGIFHNYQASPEVLKEVVDILDMWRFLETGAASLSKKDKERIATEADPFGKKVFFTGFDGNNESEHCGVARFLIEDMERFEHFKDRGLDAHMPTLEAHRTMLAAFEQIRPNLTGRELNASEIIEVLNARLRPSGRKPATTSAALR